MIKIKKAKVKNRSLEIEMNETVLLESGTNVTNEVTKKCAALAHDELIAAFENLRKHMIKICDFKKSELITRDNIENFDTSILDEYSVYGFSVGGNEDSEGVTLIGCRKFDSGKVLNIVTPFTPYSSDDYEFGNTLASDIEACIYQVEEYLNGKCAVKQLEIPFEDGEVATFEVKPEKAGRKKKKEMDYAEEAVNAGGEF